MKNSPSALKNERVRKMQFALARSQNSGYGFWTAVVLNLFLTLRDLSSRIPTFKITLRVDQEVEEPEAPLSSLNPNEPFNPFSNTAVWGEILVWLSSQDEEDLEDTLEKMDEILGMVYNEEILPHKIILEERQAAKPSAPVVTQPRPAPARPAAPALAPPKAPSTPTPAANPLEKLSQKVAEDEVAEVASEVEQQPEAVKAPKALTPKQARRAKRRAEAEAKAAAEAEAKAEAEAQAEAEGKKEAANAKRRSARAEKKAAQSAGN